MPNHFEDVTILAEDDSNCSSQTQYHNLCKHMREKQTEWVFEKGPFVESDIHIYNKGTNKTIATRGTKLIKTGQGIRIAFASKQLKYQSGAYYFEYKLKNAGDYTNLLVGVAFRSIDGQNRPEYDGNMQYFLGNHKGQYGMYLDGRVWNNNGIHDNNARSNFDNLLTLLEQISIVKEKRVVGVYVDTFTMKFAFMNAESTTGLIYDIKEDFPEHLHPLIYRDRVVALYPAVSLDHEGDKCTIVSHVPIPHPIE